MDQTLLKTLEDVGLTQKEASVYLALLELSQGTVSKVAKITDLKRPIVYVVLERLIKDGYVNEVPDKKVNEYQAIDPVVVLQKVKVSAKNFSEMLPLLQTLHHTGREKPKIHYIENKDGILKIYREMLYSKEIFCLTSYARIDEHFPGGEVDSWMKYWEKTNAKHLVADNPRDIELGKELKKHHQEVKVFSAIKQLDMDFVIYDDKIALTSLKENPFMVLIQSRELVDSMKKIFEIAWVGGKEI